MFISSKKLDARGAFTEDHYLAEALYDRLATAGLNTFLSTRSLEALGASAYKSAIDQALDEAGVLVAVGTSAEHLNSGWVKYEWDGFLNDVLSGLKPGGRIFVYVKDVQIAALPRPLRQTQVFTHGDQESQRLLSFIQNAGGARSGPDSAS